MSDNTSEGDALAPGRNPDIPGDALRIDIVPVGNVDDTVLLAVEDALSTQLAASVTTQRNVPLPEGLSRDDGAYPAEMFIEIARDTGEGDRNLAVTRYDIGIEDREWVFGLAMLRGESAVVSTYQLTRSATGNGFCSPRTALERIRKEAVHEIGHTLGYYHCANPDCVMRFSIDVASIDGKQERFCGQCRSGPPSREADSESDPSRIANGRLH